MFKAIGTILVLYAVSNMFFAAVDSFERAAIATFGAVETAATLSSQQLSNYADQ